MEIQKLRYFTTVAKHLNFTKAAQENFIAQTAMSRHIAGIERELSVTLFFRGSRSVRLTPAGEAFYRDAVALVMKYDEAVSRVKSIAKGFAESIKIGFGQLQRPLVLLSVQCFREQCPDVEVIIEQHSTRELLERLFENQLDIAFLLRFHIQEFPQITGRTLVTDSPRIVAAQTHPLAKLGKISPQKLNGQTVVSASESKSLASRERVISLCRHQGFEPGEIVQTNSNEAKVLHLETGVGIAFLPFYMKDRLSKNLVFLDLERPFYDPEHSQDNMAVSLKENRNPRVRDFFDVLATLDLSAESLL